MELGALVCTPRSPSCDACPVSAAGADLCAARASGRERELPTPAKKRASIDVRLEVALVERDGEVLLERRPDGGRMAGLWELPTRELTGTGLWPAEHKSLLVVGEPLGEVAHAITHHRIRARVRAARLGPERVDALPDSRFVPREAAAGFASGAGLTGMARKILARFAVGDDPALRLRRFAFDGSAVRIAPPGDPI